MKEVDVDKEVEAAMALSEDVEATVVTTTVDCIRTEDGSVFVPDGGEFHIAPITPDTTSIQEAIDERLGEFFKGKQLDGVKEEFRKEMQEVAYGLRKFFKEEIKKMSKQMKSDFMEELKRL